MITIIKEGRDGKEEEIGKTDDHNRTEDDGEKDGRAPFLIDRRSIFRIRLQTSWPVGWSILYPFFSLNVWAYPLASFFRKDEYERKILWGD